MSEPKLTAEELERLLYSHFPDLNLRPFQVDLVEHMRARVRLRYHPAHLRPGGTISGPALMALADTAMYIALLGAVGPEEVTDAVTVNLSINFLRKAPAADVIGEARLLKVGKRLAVGNVEMFSSEEGESIAHATVTYSIPTGS